MREEDSYQELLLRYLDGTLCPGEEAQVAELLRRPGPLSGMWRNRP